MKMAAIAIAAVVCGTAVADIDFEGLPSGSPVYNGYQGFNWNSSFYALDGTNYGTPSGYKVLGTMVGYNAWEASPINFWLDDGTFDVFSVDMCTAWYTWTDYRLEGLLDGTVVYSNVFRVTSDVPNYLSLDYTGIDEFKITTVDSSYIQYWDGGSGTHFAIDNIVTVPAPGALALLGLAGLAGRRRR